uniref:Transcription factor CBF/NF-Y/archaeal histone domain-containing protein n=1 Tax=Leersia perrieri TaxID=77586 RepID=A0A0D9XGZ4_9ORYZ
MAGEKAEKGSQPQPAQAAAEVEELPKAIVRRLVKEKLAAGGAEVIVNRDAMSAFAESARIFIHYLSATANDMCKESKRQTINADDVLKALDEMEFPEFVEPLNTSLQEFRNKNAARRSGTTQKKAEKKRKIDKESEPQEQNDAADDANETMAGVTKPWIIDGHGNDNPS